MTSFAKRSLLGMMAVVVALSGCSMADEDWEYVGEDARRQRYDPQYGQSVFGEGGLKILGGGSEEAGAPGGGIGVNSFLWRASLDTISFMPLSSADPFGGVIITDWYAPPETPDERFKMTVYILDRTLRADGLRVAVFRQERVSEGQWIDREINPGTAVSLENRILERARQLRTASISE